MSREPNGVFEISWSDDYGYRVSVPRLLEESERLRVIPFSEYAAVAAELERFRGPLMNEAYTALGDVGRELEELREAAIAYLDHGCCTHPDAVTADRALRVALGQKDRGSDE